MKKIEEEKHVVYLNLKLHLKNKSYGYWLMLRKQEDSCRMDVEEQGCCISLINHEGRQAFLDPLKCT